MIPSNTRYYSPQFDCTSAPGIIVCKEHRFSSPPLSSDSESYSDSSHHTKQYDNQLSCQAPLTKQNTLIARSFETKLSAFDEEQGLRICVEGIPESGAKSRVETQIKLLISLTTKSGEKVPCWSYIRISESLLARCKLRKTQQQKLLDGSAATMVSNESKVLELDARVVCESDESKRIKMCQGCVRRERKRAGRKKGAKASDYNMDAQTAKEAFERDRKRVLLFNCERLINFNTGEAVVPTRITCYCRHHNERIGFRVRFSLKNNKGVVIATGQSPPIMITDDHKGSKEHPSICDSRKRTRAVSTETEDCTNALATPVSSRKNSACEIDSDNVSPTTQSYFSDLNGNNSTALDQPLLTPGEETPASNSIYNESNATSPDTPTSTGIWQDISVNPSSYGHFQLPIIEKSTLHHRRTKINMTASPPPIMINNNVVSPARKYRRTVAPGDTCLPSLLTNPLQYSHTDAVSSVPISVSPSTISSPPIILTATQSALVPILNHLEPSLGPKTGGTEITILGQNFQPGLVAMFGDQEATTISCNANTIVCLLPTMEKTGPVVLSFKEHPFLRHSPEPPMFNYYEASHQDMIDLALQVSSSTNSISAVQRNTYASFPQRNIEMEVIHLLPQQQQYVNEIPSNMGGQNLLHLAAHLNYGGLAHLLLVRNSALAHTLDRNGLTPLHFACLSKSTFVIELLLKAGAHVGAMSSIGTPLQIVSTMLDASEYTAFQKEISSGQPNINPVPWLPNIFVYAVSEVHQRNNAPFANLYFENSIASQHQSSLLYHHI